MQLKKYGPGTIRYKFRMARFAKVSSLIQRLAATREVVRILDLGGTPDYWATLFGDGQAPNVHITLLNQKETEVPSPQFLSVAGDACAVEAPDNSFDMVHSNSVIEHVGAWSNQVRMAGEVRRLAPTYYIQVPYMWFPFEPHFHTLFFHWWPEQTRARMLLKRSYGFIPKQDTLADAHQMLEHHRLLDLSQFKALFPDAETTHERVFGFTKSLMATRDRIDA